MPAFDLINVHVALGGDIRSVVAKAWPENAVTFPELEILKVVHGEGSLRNPVVSGETVTRTVAEERARLLETYGEEAMKAVYGGTASGLPHKASEDLPREGKRKPVKAGGKEKPEEPDDEPVEPAAEPEPEPTDEPADESEDELDPTLPPPPPTVAKSKVRPLPR
jgi:hypothetical protein